MTGAVDSKKRVARASVEAPLVRAMKAKGRWMGNPAIKINRKAIVESIRHERENR